MDRQDYIIRIVLRARDELSGALARVRQEVEGFAGNTRDLEARSKAASEAVGDIGKSAAQAGRDAQAASRDVKEAMARTEGAVGKAKESADSLRRSYSEFRAQMREGKVDTVDAVYHLETFARAFRSLSQGTKIGSEAGAQLNRLSQDAKREADAIVSAERAAAREREEIVKRLRDARIAADKEATRAKREADKEAEKEAQREAREAEKRVREALKAREKALQESLKRQDKQREEARKREQKQREDGLKRQIGATGRETVDFVQESRQVREFEARVNRVTRSYEEFTERLDAGNVSLAEGRSQLRRYAQEFDRLASRYDVGSAEAVRFGSSADGARAALRQLNNEIRSGRDDVDQHRSLMERWSDSIERNGFHLASLSAQLRGLAYAAAITFAQQLLTVLTALGGTLISVASSASLAGAALAGGLAAGAAQAIPAVALLVGALSRVSAVMDAVKQAQLVAEQQGSRTATTARNQAGAADALASAQDGLVAANLRVADANREAEEASERLREARRDARRELTDLILAEREAELAARGASLSQEEAQDALRQALSAGATGDIARRRLSIDESRLGGAQAAERLRRARADAARAITGGVERMPTVVDARRGVEDAQRQVEEAERGVERAERAVRAARRQGQAAGEEAIASAGKLDFLLANLSASERQLYRALKRIRDTWNEQWRGITDVIVDSFTYAVDRADEILRDPQFIRAGRELATAMADSGRRVVDAFTDDGAQRQFLLFASESGRNMGVLADASIDVGRALMDIAEGAGPLLREIVDRVRSWAGGFREATSDIGELESFFDRTGDHLFAWVDAAGAVLELFKELIGVSEDEGLTAIKDFAEQVRKGSDYIRDNSAEVNRFFKDARESSYDVIRVLWELAKAVVEVFDPDHTENFADFLIEVIIPAFQNAIETLGIFTNLFTSLLSLPVVSDIFRLAIEFGIFVRILRTFSTLAFAGKVALLGREASETAPAVKGLFNILGDVGGRLRTLPDAVKGLGAAFRALAGGRGIGAAVQAFKDYVTNARRAREAKPPAPGGPGGGAGGGPVILDRNGRPIARDGDVTPVRTRPTRRQRVARGVGAAAVVGGIGAGLAFDPGAIEELGDVGNTTDTKLRNLEDTLGSLLSLDIGGVFRGIGATDDADNLAGFADEAEEKLAALVKDRNVKGIRDIGDEARRLADQFPDAAEALEAFADGADDAADHAEELNEKLRGTGRFADRIAREGGIEADDIIKPNAVAQFLSNLERMRGSGVNSIADLRRNMRFNVEQISAGIEEGSESWFNAMTRNFGSGIRALDKAMRDGTISTDKGMKEIRRITRQQMRFVRDHMDELSRDGREAIAGNFASARRAIERQTGGWRKATGDALRDIRKLMREELELYGLSPRQARNIAKGNGRGGQFGDMDNNRGREGGAPINYGDAEGRPGFVGAQGERGADSWSSTVAGRPVGRGEAVLNWAHQKYVEPALNYFYGHGMADMFRRVRGFHAGNVTAGTVRGFAGGFAGRTPSGNRAVPIPGFPGEFIASHVLRDALALVRRFRLFITDAFATSGHRGGGHLRTGTAVDVVPGPRGNWDLVDAAVQYARSKRLNVLYDGVAGHGRGHHAHIDLVAGAVRGASGQLRRALRRLNRTGISGPESPLKDVGVAAVENVRAGARRLLRRVDRDVGLGTPEGMEDVKPMSPDADVVSAFRRAIRRTGAPRIAQLALWMAGIVESGLRNLAYGDADSEGALQLRTGLHGRGLARNPFAAALAFLTRGFTGRGGAIDIAASNPDLSAGQVAQAVQGSAFPSRYDQVRAQAMRYLGMALGGVIPGYGGGDRHVRLLEGGEHILTKEEVRAAGGHGAIFALRRMLGGGRQGGPGAFQDGGANAPTPFAVRMRAIGRGDYRLPDILPLTVEGVSAEIGRLNRALRSLERKSKDSLAKFTARFVSEIGSLTREGGLLDQMDQAMERAAARRQVALTQDAFDRRNGGVVRVLTDEQVAGRELDNIVAEGDDLRGARGAARGGLGRVDARLRRVDSRLGSLRRGTENAAQRREISALTEQRQNLVANRRNLRDRIAAYDQRIADNLQARFDAQVNAFQAQVSAITDRFDRAGAGLDRRTRVAEALGRTGDVDAILVERIRLAQGEIGELSKKLAQAKRAGLTDVARDIEEQIAELQTSITEMAVDQLRRAADAVNSRAQSGLFYNDLAQRVANIGDTDFGAQGRALRARGDILSRQRSGLETLAAQALAQGNTGLFAELRQSINDLTVQILENEEAIRDNTRAQRQAAIDRIAGRGSFLGGVAGGLHGIVETIGAVTGTVNFAELLEIAQAVGQTLRETGSGLREQLFSIFGVDLRGLTGMDFVNAVQSLDFDALTANMSDEDRAQFEALIASIIDNEGAVQDNTKELQELNGQAQQQSFQSSFWEAFRYAIFNGNGGLMPQFAAAVPAIPGVNSAGTLSAASAVAGPTTRRGGSLEAGGDTYNTYITNPTQVLDENYVGERIAFTRKTRGR